MWQLSTSDKVVLKPPSDGKKMSPFDIQDKNLMNCESSHMVTASLLREGAKRDTKTHGRKPLIFSHLMESSHWVQYKCQLQEQKFSPYEYKLIIYISFDQQRKISSDCFAQINDLPLIQILSFPKHQQQAQCQEDFQPHGEDAQNISHTEPIPVPSTAPLADLFLPAKKSHCSPVYSVWVFICWGLIQVFH